MKTLPTILGHAAGGFPIYLISGSEGQGYSTQADIVTKTLDGQSLGAIWDEFQLSLSVVNDERTALANLLSFRTTRSADAVAQTVGDDDFELASEFGEPVGLRARPELVTCGYPFHDYDKATRFTYRYLRDATREEIEAVHARALYSDNKLVSNAILGRLLDPTEDVNSDGRTVFGLYNGDSALPPRYGFNTHEAGHTHFLVTGSETADGGDLDVMADHITHHGYGTTPGSQLVLLVNKVDLPTITAARAGVNGAQYDFIPSRTAPAYLAEAPVVGDVAPGEYNRLKIVGSYGDVFVASTEYMPPGWMIMVATDGPNGSHNAVGFREHINPAHHGLLLLPGNQQRYPLVDSYYTRGFGVGVRHRGAAVAMQITEETTYTAPVSLPPFLG